MTISYFRTAQTLITGRNSISKIGEEAKKLGSKKAMIITDKVIRQTGLLSKVIFSLEEINLAVDIMDEVMPEPPFENLEQ
ncbi:iron-containing alcohol dehydrogenase [Priestia endophytica]|uniref:iron-containing alcohol dehydrogenase n=1 Tax=Priestia endophytica TaxID=135735 RepID=UPI0024139B02|nr:iron-containing alcohol dehydrogenase [Priestia endophytica]